MLKLLIIDDEKLIREGLINYIKWNELDIEVVGTAGDGQSALALIFDLSPDILISDIKMPSISGIEMLQELRNRGFSTEVIFISAYSDFKYAQDALKLGAFDYILKPIEENVLIEIVKKCKTKIANNKREKQINIDIKEADYLSQEQKLLQSLTGKTMLDINPSDIFLFDFSLIMLANIKSINASKQLPVDIEQCILQLYSSENLQEFVAKYVIVETNKTEKSIIFLGTGANLESFYEKVRIFCIKLQEALSSPEGFLSISLSNCNTSKVSLSYIYNEACCAALYKSTNKDSTINEFRSVKKMVNSKVHSAINYNRLLNYVQNEDTENVHTFFNDVLLTFINTDVFNNIDLLKIEFSKILDYVFDNLSEYTIKSALSDMNCDFSFRRVISRQNNISELLEVSKTIIFNIIDFLNGLPSKTSNKLVSLALGYIHNNYNKNLNLNEIANHLYITPSYLSKIFSEEMGVSFSRYLLKYRVEMAKKLLSDPKHKVYEVSEMVGYSDVCHFTKIFKEIEGITPAKYRERKF